MINSEGVHSGLELPPTGSLPGPGTSLRPNHVAFGPTYLRSATHTLAFNPTSLGARRKMGL
jgi:hypothetical protein